MPVQIGAELQQLRGVCPQLEALRVVAYCDVQPCLIWAWAPQGDAMQAVDSCPDWPWDNSVSGLVMRPEGSPVWFSDLVDPGQSPGAAHEAEVLRRQAQVQDEALRRLGLDPG